VAVIGAARKQGYTTTWARALVAFVFVALAVGTTAAACSLGNVAHEDCTTDTQCAAAFGAGSRCETGFCTEATSPGCQKTGADGRACFGCTPKVTRDFETACTDATCAPFDDAKRLTKLTPDGGLPPLP
jgi:hypothetical protein